MKLDQQRALIDCRWLLWEMMLHSNKVNDATMMSSSSSSLPLCSSSSSHSHLFSDGLGTPIARKWLMLASFTLFLPWGLYTRTVSQLRTMTNDVRELQEMKRSTTYQLDTKRHLMEALASEKERIERSNKSLVSSLRESGVLVDTHADHYNALEERETHMIGCIDELEHHIQDNSKNSLEQDYGPGPYQVELVLRSKAHMRVQTQTVLIALSPAMPHASHHFLRMVRERLWNGMSFMPQHSNPSRIQASPIDMETLNSMDWKFENAKLKSLAFAEQSPDYACGSYSVGFSGMPGGPDFFINSFLVLDGSAGESCFGKVVQGKQVINSIIDKKESSIVGIESLRLLPQKNAR